MAPNSDPVTITLNANRRPYDSAALQTATLCAMAAMAETNSTLDGGTGAEIPRWAFTQGTAKQ